MPHATLPATGFQAFILCGPGESLAPFNANPTEFPKALIPIANRPMVWYPLEWCYRMGVTNITLLTPASSSAALEAALSQNPHLTSLPSPRPTLLAPQSLTLTTGTAELFRLPEVQAAITGDFIILPCDIVCELSGSSLLESWMTMQGGLGGTTFSSGAQTVAAGLGGERSGRRGGLGVWYQTRDTAAEGGVGVKKEETDFLATTVVSPLPTVPAPSTSLLPHIRNVALAMPSAVLTDILDEQKALHVRHALLRKHGRVKMQMTLRDAHLYFFPYWVKEFMKRNETFESVGEDVVGWWAKAGWQEGLAQKLGIADFFDREDGNVEGKGKGLEEEVDLKSLSSTWTSVVRTQDHEEENNTTTATFASRVRTPPSHSSHKTTSIPPIHSYIHPAHPPASLIRRVDTVPLLLSVSLSLARLDPTSDQQQQQQQQTSPFSHPQKIHPTTPLPPQCTLKPDTNLVDANVTLSPKSTIKDCVIGANCSLGAPVAPAPPPAEHSSSSSNSTSTTTAQPPSKPSSKPTPTGVRLNRTLIMEGAVVEPGCKLNGCVLGRRCRIGADSELTDCYVQEGFAVAVGTVAKGEVLAMGVDEGEGGLLGGEGYDDEEEDGDGDGDEDDGGDEDENGENGDDGDEEGDGEEEEED